MFTKEREAVLDILKDIQKKGDEALINNTLKWDKVSLSPDKLKIPAKDYHKGSGFSDEMKNILKSSKQNIEEYQSSLLPDSSHVLNEKEGVSLGLRYTPMDRVGVYIPGGTAPLISTVLMTVIPAKIAGVKEVVVVSPPTHEGKIHPAITYACDLCGVDEVYQVGGAQAIGALAYGTSTIKPVDKIVGPGNVYVALAKKEVFGLVDIDMIAGPSEIMLVTDEKTPVDWVVCDLMSQAEHDPLAASYLICSQQNYAERVIESFEKKMKEMPRREIIERSWENHAGIFVVEDDKKLAKIVNALAPEHLQLMIDDPQSLLDQVKHAGAIFLGRYAPEPLGDYWAGPSHVLPTSGAAKFSSPLSVMSFLKTSSLISYTPEAFEKVALGVGAFARLEGLEAHAQSMEIRLKKKKSESV
ncbi:histidinol dehydrogenase [PVC group bacterium (ex Bugula neritina AB1)]|nr:histidinol dehydrogenase [PVC group bacterium (ex Bugula neritina AB1)]